MLPETRATLLAVVLLRGRGGGGGGGGGAGGGQRKLELNGDISWSGMQGAVRGEKGGGSGFPMDGSIASVGSRSGEGEGGLEDETERRAAGILSEVAGGLGWRVCVSAGKAEHDAQVLSILPL